MMIRMAVVGIILASVSGCSTGPSPRMETEARITFNGHSPNGEIVFRMSR